MINDLEKKILKSLNEDARKSFRDVAKEIGTSTTTIYNNVKKMERSGVLEGYVPAVNEELLGYNHTAVIMLRIAQGKIQKVLDVIIHYPEVREIYDVTGDWDTVLVCFFKTRKDLDRFLKVRLTLPHVERVMTYMVLNVIKDEKRAFIWAL
jgi:Lrp/AsnC family transcriptional regulator, regulator for asnA, asnC and gidA